MSNLTIALDANYIQQGRIRALQEGTSLSAQIRAFVRAYARHEVAPVLDKPVQDELTLAAMLDEVARKNPPQSVTKWSREELNTRA